MSEGSPGGGNGNPLQYSFLGNAMHRGALWVTVGGVAKSEAQALFHACCLLLILHSRILGSVSPALVLGIPDSW